VNVTQKPDTLVATGAVLSLNREAERVGLSVADESALGDHQPRQWMARRIVWTFVVANAVTLAALALLVWLDQNNMAAHLISPADRIVGNQVILALLGATTVQVGTVAAIIARYLFPSRERGDHA
jgi:hypothetical protein